MISAFVFRFLPILISGFWLLASAPAYAGCANPAGVAAEIVYNASTKQLQYCNDTDWIAMHPPGSGSGGCNTVTMGLKPEKHIFYNADNRVLQACAGSVWRAMGPIGGANLGGRQPHLRAQS